MTTYRYRTYTIKHYEQGCGCNATAKHDIYDRWGNQPEYFETEDAADAAGQKAMEKRKADNYKILHVPWDEHNHRPSVV